ncbi:hypothetical protein ThimaDRAFT_2566 [Thiocapsa marina 5811]|uniref:Uncharacterized protein n=1 Tax=Thiocapsa marina 5811 TaxID=768671 RepID=F9UCB4_9GAMM|nr:hypothetical protein ThimaDRAFT_2566 [Thiocapsa marina 5811]
MCVAVAACLRPKMPVMLELAVNLEPSFTGCLLAFGSGLGRRV